MWTTPNPVPIYQSLILGAEVICNQSPAPTGTVTFDVTGNPIGTSDVSSVTATNFALYSSQFNNPAWLLSGDDIVLTPNYTTSPLGDQTAYRYQANANLYGNAVIQNVNGLVGSQPATFSIWVESNTGNVQDIRIGIYDNVNGTETETPCLATSTWQRCSVTTPSNTNSVQVYIGSGSSTWQWDVSIWGSQVESSPSAGVYVASGGSPATATRGFATYQAFVNTGGYYPISAAYSGDATCRPSTSPTYTQLVNPLQIIGFCAWPEYSPPCSSVPLPSALVGVAYSTTLAVVGGTPPYTWSLGSGQSLPSGLTLNGNSGMISGTPTTPSQFGQAPTIPFLVLVSDSSNPPQTVAQEFQMVVVVGASMPSDATHRPQTCGGFILPPYINQAAAGTSNQSITIFGCIGIDNGNYGTLTLNLPTNSGIHQVGSLTPSLESPDRGNCSMVQGTINIDKNATPGPVQIGLTQMLDGCNENTNSEPYYITQFCPASVTLSSPQGQQFPFVGSQLWDQGYRTGVGDFVPVKANPDNGDGYWNSALIWEYTSQVSNTCPASIQHVPMPICYFNASQEGNVGTAVHPRYNPTNNDYTLPATNNIFWDQHFFIGTTNVLAGTINGNCSATCRQWYYCGNIVEGMFSVNFTLNETNPTPPDVPYTLVGATVH